MGLRDNQKQEMPEQKKIAFEPTPAPERPVYPQDDDSLELDAIERLKANIHMLNDLHYRLRFMNDELESLLGSRKKKN